MTREPESIRLELDYLRLVIDDAEQAHAHIRKASAELGPAAVAVVELAIVAALRGAGETAETAMSTLRGSVSASLDSLLAASARVVALVELLAGRARALADEAGIELDDDGRPQA